MDDPRPGDAPRQAVTDPDAFVAVRAEAIDDVDAFVDRIVTAHRDVDAVPWLRRATDELVATVRPLDLRKRVPWYGPEMSLGMAVTARLMETWAHGQDVADALGVERAPTKRLEHIALLGARTLPNSFRARGLPVPEDPVRVELDGIAFGPEGARNLVRGSTLDFCLVVTQRRNVFDTALLVDGPVATAWMQIAQAFAGPPGVGR
jgi:uncharacterized protein (TIGR03084 family)